jgi:hypothetical protein
VPFHLQKPEAYVNELRDMNGGRQRAQLERFSVDVNRNR